MRLALIALVALCGCAGPDWYDRHVTYGKIDVEPLPDLTNDPAVHCEIACRLEELTGPVDYAAPLVTGVSWHVMLPPYFEGPVRYRPNWSQDYRVIPFTREGKRWWALISIHDVELIRRGRFVDPIQFAIIEAASSSGNTFGRDRRLGNDPI